MSFRYWQLARSRSLSSSMAKCWVIRTALILNNNFENAHTQAATRIAHIEVISMCSGVGEHRECRWMWPNASIKDSTTTTTQTQQPTALHIRYAIAIFYQIALSVDSHLSRDVRTYVCLCACFSLEILRFVVCWLPLWFLLNSLLKKHIVACVSISLRCHFIRAPLYQSLFTLLSVFKTHTTTFLPCF